MSVKQINFDDLDTFLDTDAEDIVSFDPEDHTYISDLDGKEYISTTKLLKHYSLSPSEYDQVPESILRAKAAYGSAVHKALELYLQGDASQVIIPEVKAFEDWLNENNMSIHDCISEQQVFNREYGIAGTVDLQMWNIIADFKTTATLHTISVMWQLSIYNFLLHPDEVAYNNYTLKCFWFSSSGALTVKDIPMISWNVLMDMLGAWKRGEPIWIDGTIPTTLSDKVDELVKQKKLIDAVKANLKTLTNEEEILKVAIKEQMDQQQRIYVQSPTGIITVTEYDTSRYDTKKVDALLAQHGLPKDNYVNTTRVVKMNVKELKVAKP